MRWLKYQLSSLCQEIDLQCLLRSNPGKNIQTRWIHQIKSLRENGAGYVFENFKRTQLNRGKFVSANSRIFRVQFTFSSSTGIPRTPQHLIFGNPHSRLFLIPWFSNLQADPNRWIPLSLVFKHAPRELYIQATCSTDKLTDLSPFVYSKILMLPSTDQKRKNCLSTGLIPQNWPGGLRFLSAASFMTNLYEIVHDAPPQLDVFRS